MTQLISLISTKEITMLKDIDAVIKINKIGKFKYFYIPNMEIVGINKFISKLYSNSAYIIIPLITMFAKDNDLIFILSTQILVSNNSSAKVIHDYLNNKLDQVILDFD
jgi:hypothetical protein